MLTVYGIETHRNRRTQYCLILVATVLTVYGIETYDAINSFASLN